MDDTKLFLITGPPRTGTSAMSMLLSLHPNIIAFNELCCFDFAPHGPKHSAVNVLKNKVETLRKFPWRKDLYEIHRLADSQKEYIINNNLSNKKIVKYLCNTLPENMIIGDKVPIIYIHTFDRIISKYPNIKVVFCYRDGRDVIASQLSNKKNIYHKNEQWTCETVAEGENYWLNTMIKWEQLKSTLEPNMYYEVKYEKFSKNPNKHIVDLIKWLGVEESKQSTADSIIKSVGYKPTNVGRWKEKYPNIELELSNEFKECLKRWGYK